MSTGFEAHQIHMKIKALLERRNLRENQDSLNRRFIDSQIVELLMKVFKPEQTDGNT